jgi:hypothetical protein
VAWACLLHHGGGLREYGVLRIFWMVLMWTLLSNNIVLSNSLSYCQILCLRLWFEGRGGLTETVK